MANDEPKFEIAKRSTCREYTYDEIHAAFSSTKQFDIGDFSPICK